MTEASQPTAAHAAPAPSEPPLRGLRKWALVAELVAAGGVIVSLAFVGLQLMQSNTLAREAAEQRQIEAIGNLSRIIAENPHIAGAIAKLDAGETPNPAELVAVTSLELYAQRTWEALYFQYRAGRVDPELWEAQRKLARTIQSRPLSQTIWAQEKQFFSKSYRDFRDNEVAGQAPGAAPTDNTSPPARAPEPAPQPAAPEQ